MYSATVRREVMGTWKGSEHGAQTCAGQPGVFIGWPQGSHTSTWGQPLYPPP